MSTKSLILAQAVSSFADGMAVGYDEGRRLLSVRSTLTPALSDRELLMLVRGAGRSSTDLDARGEGDRAAANLVRFDLIDVALYHALTAHPELLRTLDWRVFERLLADILETFGYVVELQRGCGPQK